MLSESLAQIIQNIIEQEVNMYPILKLDSKNQLDAGLKNCFELSSKKLRFLIEETLKNLKSPNLWFLDFYL